MGVINQSQKDMIFRIIKENPNLKDKKISESNMNRIKSAMVFDTLIKHKMIVGYTNQQVYDIYCELAKTFSIHALSKIDFSRTLCKYYGFSMIDVHVNAGGKCRIYVEDAKEYFKNKKLQSAMEFMSGMTIDDVVGRTNKEIYNEYLEFCQNYNPPKKPINKIDFSRRMCIFFGVSIKNTTRNKKTYRLYFLKEGGADNGDNSSGQESLG